MKIVHFISMVLLAGCMNPNKPARLNQSEALSNPWQYKDSIMAQIKPIVFQDKTFDILAFGAIADGKTDCSSAIAQAINQCYLAGGGKVLVPQGIWLTGPIVLKSNVNLHLAQGSTLLFTTDKQTYLPVVHTRFEGMECYNYSPLIYAYQCENIAITGQGTLDGQGQVWWSWKGKWEGSVDHGYNSDSKEQQLADVEALTQMVANNVPVEQRVFGEGHYLRSSFIQPYLCKNVLIEGIKIVQAPMWVIHPVLSENIIVRKVRIESLGPNNDGCDPECCNNVLIDSCYFNTGDDCIAIKSGRNNDGRRIGVPSQNIIVQNSQMVEGHGGVVMGSEVSGDVRYVFAENCVMDSPNLERVIRIKSNTLRGGTVEHVYARNIEVKQVREAILLIDLYYGKETGENLPSVSNIHLENITSQKSKYGYYLNGVEGNPVNGIYITNCNFNNVETDNFAKNVENLQLNNVLINGKLVK